jgi:hypothetical protein
MVKKNDFAKRTHFEEFLNLCKSIRNTKTARHFGAKTNPFSLGALVVQSLSERFKQFQNVSKVLERKKFRLGDLGVLVVKLSPFRLATRLLKSFNTLWNPAKRSSR